jgi:glycosyltransferase involved in cell wall biosynthesis
MPNWSVIVTTYKRPERLHETLGRILIAVPDCAEILVADDDPEGSAEAVAREILAEHPGPSEYHCNPTNLGTVRNVNAAISRSAGPFIHWCADDDWPDPGFYREMHRGNLYEVSHCGYRNHLPDGRIWDGPMLAERSTAFDQAPHSVRLLYGNPTHMVATTFTRAIWMRLGGFDPKFPLLHDWHFLIRASLVEPTRFVAERLANYTQQAASLTGTADPAAFQAEQQAMFADIQRIVS